MCEILSKIFWLAAFFWVGYFVPVQGGRQQSPGLYLNKIVSHDESATANSVVVWRYMLGESHNNESTDINNESTDINNKNLKANQGDKQYLVYGNKPDFPEGGMMGYSQDINGESRHVLTTGRTIRL
jgi:hypothetical protein